MVDYEGREVAGIDAEGAADFGGDGELVLLDEGCFEAGHGIGARWIRRQNTWRGQTDWMASFGMRWKWRRLFVRTVTPWWRAVQPIRRSRSPISVPLARRRILSVPKSLQIVSLMGKVSTSSRNLRSAASSFSGLLELATPSYNSATDTMLIPMPSGRSSSMRRVIWAFPRK